VLGRAAMAQRVLQARLLDGRWIWRTSRLASADALILSGDAGKLLTRPSIKQRCLDFSSLMHVNPHAETAPQNARELPTNSEYVTGASVRSTLLAVRFVAGGSASLRRGIVRVLNALRPRYVRFPVSG
jgi:urease accessory protein UreH